MLRMPKPVTIIWSPAQRVSAIDVDVIVTTELSAARTPSAAIGTATPKNNLAARLSTAAVENEHKMENVLSMSLPWGYAERESPVVPVFRWFAN
jgi:hypothetical protein